MKPSNAFDKLMQAAKSPSNKRKPAVTDASGSKRAKDLEPAQLSPAASTPSAERINSGLSTKLQEHAAAVAAFKRVFSETLAAPAKQKFQYLLVYDLEATCNKARYVDALHL
jgi:hypothetical protein